MTAEIVIMNKLGVALAADSALTVQTKTEQKIYNTVNKLSRRLRYLSRKILAILDQNWLRSRSENWNST